MNALQEKTTFQKMMKVIAILMMAGSILMVLIGIIFILFDSVLGLTGAADEQTLKSMIAVSTAAGVFFSVSGILHFIISCVGLNVSKNADRANMAIFFGILSILITLVGTISSIAAHQALHIGMLLTYVLPVLYLYAAFEIKQGN